MICSMLKGKNLPNEFWVEAVNTIVYILNMSPTKVVQNMIPYEAWFKRKPQVNNLKSFRCVCYYHIPAENIKEKFDEKCEKCNFIGYNDESKRYRFYNADFKELIISRDVIFYENGA